MANKLRQLIKKNTKWIILLIFVIVFIGIVRDVYKYEIVNIDKVAYNVIVDTMRTEKFTPIMIFITNMGSALVVIGISFLSLIFLKNKKIGICVIINLIIITSTNLLLKQIVQRGRPEGYRLIQETGYSFPSGHSMVNTAFYGLLIYFVYKYVRNKYLKYSLCIVMTLLIPLIGFSRVYLGVHYASDVIAGFCISISYLMVFTTIVPQLIKLERTENINE